MFLLLLLHISGSVASHLASAPLYPADGTATPAELAGSSPLIPLQHPFVYFGKSYEQIFVNNNGRLTFDGAMNDFTSFRIPLNGSRDFIAVLWTDLDASSGGQVTYNQYTNGRVLQQATQDIKVYFRGLADFKAEFVFVATWTDVPYIFVPSSGSTFQAVLISGGQYSFLLLIYGNISPNPFAAQAGYDTVNSIQFFSLPGTFSDTGSGPSSTFSQGSNVGVVGRWAFRVDHGSTVCLRDPTPSVHGGGYFPPSYGHKRWGRSVRPERPNSIME